MKAFKDHIGIIGVGIIGLTTAVHLLQSGYQHVCIYSKDAPNDTNSDAAIANWYAPSKLRKPLLNRLCFASLTNFRELSQDPQSGVHEITTIKYFQLLARYQQAQVEFSSQITQMPDARFENSQYPYCLATRNYLMEAEIYRRFLLAKFHALGGTLILREIDSLAELALEHTVIINCGGWESVRFRADPAAYPVRGQVLLADIPQEKGTITSFEASLLHTYLVVREQSGDLAIGTTYQEDETDRKLPKEYALSLQQNILHKASWFLPGAEDLVIRKIKTGIRSGRDDVFLGSEHIAIQNKKVKVIHSYGHGGSGFSASWGTAQAIVANYIES